MRFRISCCCKTERDNVGTCALLDDNLFQFCQGFDEFLLISFNPITNLRKLNIFFLYELSSFCVFDGASKFQVPAVAGAWCRGT